MRDEHYIVGCDLGQSQDYTAIAVVQRVPLLAPATAREPTMPPLPYITRTVGPRGGVAALHTPFRYTQPPPAAYHVRHLERPPLGTKYPAIVRRVGTLLATPPLSRATPLVVDRTGVGMAVTDMFAGAGITPHAVTITGGDEVIRDGSHHTKVPKRELVGTLVAVFQTERLRIAAGLVEGATLVNELTNFKVKVNLATGHDSYEAWRESVHDDLVLAVALAVWHGERGCGPPPMRQWNYLHDNEDEDSPRPEEW